MIQAIIDGIIKTIKTEYGKSFRIYTESVEQGLIEPCFFVRCLSPMNEREVSDRYRRTYPFMITYFPSTEEPYSECHGVCETLFGLLNDVETDIGVVHMSETSGEIVDGNLQFSMQCQVFASVDKESDGGMDGVSIGTAIVR